MEDDCWREILVPASTSLAVLSDQIIAPVMGWARGYHGYMFVDTADGATLGPKSHAGYIDMMHVGTHFKGYMDDHDIPLALILKKPGDYCLYTYDLGDRWEHVLEVVEVITPDKDAPKKEFGEEVELVDGYGACPPEDSNGQEEKGVMGYRELLELYKKKPAKCKKALADASASVNYRYKPFTFMPMKFDLSFHRAELKRCLMGPRVQASRSLGMCNFTETYVYCWACKDRLKPLQRCAQCATALYCSRDCQKAHWKKHKKNCSILAGEAKGNK